MDIIKKTFLVGTTESDDAPRVITRRFFGHISEKTAIKWARSKGLKKIMLTHTHYDRDDSRKGVWDVRETVLTVA